MTPLTTNFRSILDGLKVTLGLIAHRDARVRAVLTLAWYRIHRTINRFERLVALWQSGKLPKPSIRAPRAKRPSPTTPAPRLPSGQAWLVRRLQDHHVNTRASQLQHFLANTPELPEFLAAAPQANRLLRPLCTMLGITPPVPLPPRAQAARPARPRKPPRPRPARPRPPRPSPPAAPTVPSRAPEPSFAHSPLGLRFLPL